jgi:hypothetical protein
MAPKWSYDTNCKFVELYKQNECLWNMTIPMYKNKQARSSATLQIVNETHDLKINII